MSKRKKNPKSIQIDNVKVAKSDIKLSFYDKFPVWRFSKFDINHVKWGISSLDSGVIKRMADYERMPWKDIMQDLSGRRANTKNHFVDFDKICQEARDRLDVLNLLDGADSLFSLTVQGKVRIWGFLNDGVFDVLWIDREHEIFPMNR